MTAVQQFPAGSMLLADLMSGFGPASEWSWAEERAWLEENHPRRMARLRRLIEAEGIEVPVRLCGGCSACTSPHVVDGHHRVVVALLLGLESVPVADAWEQGADWMYYMDDNPGDDPVR